MKKNILFLIFISITIFGQESGKASFDLLRVSNSPAFLILDVDEEKIQRPNTPTDFQISIKEASENFTLIPKNYSLEFAPYWIFGGDSVNFKGFAKRENPIQTLLVSLATITSKDSLTNIESRKLAFGLKISLVRGKIKSKVLDEIHNNLKRIDSIFASKTFDITGKDSIYKYLKSKDSIILKQVSTLQDSLKNQRNNFSKDTNLTNGLIDMLLTESDKIEELLNLRKNELDSTKIIPELKINARDLINKAETIELKRYGFKLDLAAGVGIDFPTNSFDSVNVNRFSGWFTTGWDWEDNLSLFFSSKFNVERYADSIGNYITKPTVEYGFKGVVDKVTKNLSISGEALGLTFLNKEDGEFKWRFLLNISYEIFKNKLVTFNIGKEYDKKIETGGNLIATLKLILGFGSLRPLL